MQKNWAPFDLLKHVFLATPHLYLIMYINNSCVVLVLETPLQTQVVYCFRFCFPCMYKYVCLSSTSFVVIRCSAAPMRQYCVQVLLFRTTSLVPLHNALSIPSTVFSVYPPPSLILQEQ